MRKISEVFPNLGIIPLLIQQKRMGSISSFRVRILAGSIIFTFLKNALKICIFALIIVTKSCCVSGIVAQWIRHLTTNQGIPGSNPGGVDHFCFCEKCIKNLYICLNNCDAVMLCKRPRGPMDKASDYESGDSRFESWRGRSFLLL